MIPKLDTYSISFAVRHNSKVLKCIKFILFKMGKPFSTVATISLLKVLLILFNTLFWVSKTDMGERIILYIHDMNSAYV